MKYGLIKDNAFVLIDDDLERLKNTIPFLPDYSESDIQTFDDDEVEQGYDGGWYLKGHAPAVPADVALAKAKEVRAEAVDAITVEVDGMTFDGNESAQQRMARTVAIATANNLPMTAETKWVLADNTIAQVTLQQLAQACLLASEKQTELWVKPYEQ